MALSQKHRSSIYEHLAPLIGEEETEALLSQFPGNDLDVPATKEFVHATASDVRAEVSDLRAEMHERLGDLRAEMHAGFAAVNDRLRQQTIWIVSAVSVGMGIAAGIGRL